MHKARTDWIREEHLRVSGVCFEPLEPRLLLSGSWGDGIGSSTPDNQAHSQDSLTQKTPSLEARADIPGSQAEHHPSPMAGRIDLLAQTPALISKSGIETNLEGTLPSNQASMPPLTHSDVASNENSSAASNSDTIEGDEIRELILVNEDVADYQALIEALQSNHADRNFDVVVLDTSRDGVTQISEILADHSDLSAVHIITHGAAGQINIGNTYLDRSVLQKYSSAIADWGNALTEKGDLLFYGCNVAADSDGQAMLNDVAALTGADVAASIDPTGNRTIGGDWQLEYTKGAIEADIFQAGTNASWSHLLAAPTITSNGGGPTANVDVVENTTTVTTVTANDIDGDTPTFNISGGADASLFDIDTNSGLLTFQDPPDFENRTDDDNNGIYEVIVMADDGFGGTDTQAISVTVTNADNALWISTDDDAAPPGANGLPSGWTEGEVLDFGGPSLNLGPATGGEFSSVINFDNFTANATDPGALHFVARDVTVGSGANQFNLQIGDILVSFNQVEDILAVYSETGIQTTVHTNDLLAFRPDNPGDYSTGAFYTLLNGVPDPNGNPINSLHAISLVEQDTYVAGTLLTEGSFIFSEQLGTVPNTPNHIYHFTPTDAGTAAAAGVSQILIDGDDINIENGKNIRGLELIEKSTTIGGLTLDTGDILVTLSVDDASAGDNGLNTATQDIFVLKVTQAEPEAGNLTAATAEMVLDGSLVGLDGTERIYAITSVPDNYGPVIGGDVTGMVTEDVGVVAGNITDAGTLTIADPNAGESSFIPETVVGSYGSLTINAAGAWIYTADNSQAAIQNLNAGDSLTDTCTVTSADGTTQRITITIDGAGEAPIARPDGVNLIFDGNDFIQIADDPSLQMTNNVTMEAWINHSGLGTGSQIILNKEGEYELGITADTGEIIYAIADSVSSWGWHRTGHIVTAGEWTHVAVAFDGGAGEINTYINGVKVDTFAQPGPMGDVYPLYDDLYIGGRENAITQRFQGQIDDVRVWNTTRAQGEIQSNMNGQLTGAEPGLAGYWRLDEGGDGTVVDQSGSGNSGTLGGAEGAAATPAYQGYITDEDTLLTVPAVSGVLANDTDPNGDPMTVTNLDTTGMLGNLVLNAADGSFTYDPNGAFESLDPGEHAIETFTYTANDGTSDSNTVTATITIVGANESPLAVADNFTVDEGSTTNLDLALNDSDADDGLDPASIAIVSGPTYGSIVVNTDGTVDYSHNGSEIAADSFTYTIDDLAGATSNTVTVSLTITPQNDSPVATADSFTIDEGSTTNLDLALNDSDADDGLDPASIAIVSGPTYGSIVVNTDGTVDYSHNGSEIAADSFTYTIDDLAGATSNTVTVSLTITPQNDSPVATADSFTIDEGSTTNLDLAVNDSDADDGLDPASIVIVSGPANGSVLVNTNGTVNYTHNGSETTADSFTYTIDDLAGATSNTVTVSLTITPQNDAPVATADSFTVNEGSTTNLNLAVNDSDADDGLDPASIAIVSGPANGSIVVNTNGTVNYTHNGSETTADSFTYTIDDLAGATSNTVTVSLTITPQNDSPVATADSFTVNEGSTTNLNLAVNDSDADDGLDPASIGIVSGPANGSVLVNTDGTVDYTHNGSETTTDSFTYTIDDMSGTTSSTVTVSLTITPTNDAPVIGGVNSGSTIEDFDPDSDGQIETVGALTITDADTGESNFQVGTVAGTYGSLTIDTAGNWTYAADNSQATIQQLDAGENIIDTLTVATADGTSVTVTITIDGAEDAPSISATTAGTVLRDTAVTAVGTLAITDVDTSDNPVVFNNAPAALGDNGYGTFTITGGTWIYVLNNANAAIQAMATGDTLTDSHTFTASDGSTQVVTVTIGVAPSSSDNTTPPTATGGDSDPVDPLPLPEAEPEEILPAEENLSPPEESTVPIIGSTRTPGNTPLQLIAPTHFVPTMSLTATDDVVQDRSASPSLADRVLNFMRHQLGNQISEDSAPDHTTFFSGSVMTEELDRIEQQIVDHYDSDAQQGQLIIGAAAGMGATVFVGYVIWAFRGASLLLGALSAMPMWRCFDPLPVLSGTYTSREEDDKKKRSQTLSDDDEKEIGELLGEKQDVTTDNGSLGGNE